MSAPSGWQTCLHRTHIIQNPSPSLMMQPAEHIPAGVLLVVAQGGHRIDEDFHQDAGDLWARPQRNMEEGSQARSSANFPFLFFRKLFFHGFLFFKDVLSFLLGFPILF